MSTDGWTTFEAGDREALADIAELDLREAELALGAGSGELAAEPELGAHEHETEFEAVTADSIAAELLAQLEALDEGGAADLVEGEVQPAARPAAFYVTVTSRAQGVLKTESKRREHAGKIPGIDFRFGVSSPRDAASGQATGRRQYGAVTMTKAWGAASPQLFTALVQNEDLASVVFEFMAETGAAETVLQTVKLADARVSSFKQVVDRGRRLEEVAFTFRSIEIENKPARTSGRDDWQSTGS